MSRATVTSSSGPFVRLLLMLRSAAMRLRPDSQDSGADPITCDELETDERTPAVGPSQLLLESFLTMMFILAGRPATKTASSCPAAAPRPSGYAKLYRLTLVEAPTDNRRYSVVER